MFKHSYYQHIKVLFIRLSLLLGLFQIARLYFFIKNLSKFSENNFGEILWAFFVGIRFDLVSIGIFNSIFIILSILPFTFIIKEGYQKILKWMFIILNSLLFLSNLLDSEYFRFTQKRSTYDIFDVIKGSDFSHMLFDYLSNYWFIFILVFISSFILFKLYPKVPTKSWERINLKFKFIQSFTILLILIIFFAIVRGFDHRPITITSAAKFANVQTVSLVLNTPFTIVNTFNKKGLKEEHFYTEETLKTIYSPIKHFHYHKLRSKNIVLIILESFGKEYSHLNNPSIPGYTPFLDSLSKKSLRFRYSFSNGKRSIEAMASIFNSSPSLMNKAYITSPYSANKTKGLAYLLKQEGYYTSFMHGGANGTMDFDKFCYMSGFDDYYGKNEYNKPENYDGNWGIFDEPYLQYAIKKMSHFKQPFFNAIFTLSSHHPYAIPNKYKNKFPKGSSVIHESIAYSDYALKNFFESAKKQDWFDNTLFILTADHTSISNQYYYQKSLGSYAIPIIFYQANDSTLSGESKRLMQHIDIMPTILDYLHYNKPFYALGNSILDTTKKDFIINQINDRYYFTNNNTYGIIYNNTVHAIYNFKKDSLLKHNLIKNKSVLEEYNKNSFPLFKAIKQTYNNDLIHNKTFYTK